MKKIPEDIKKVSRRAALLGFVLAIVCHVVPPDYRAVCELISNVCAGHF